MNPKTQTETIEITNFGGPLTRKLNGDLNSGLAKFATSWGYDPFSKPGNLTWFEAPIDIDPTNAVVTGTIVCSKARIETGGTLLFEYAVDTNGRVYKLQPSQLGSPNYDNATLLATLTGVSFPSGGDIEFYGATEKIYISHSTGVKSITFAGGSETAVVAGLNSGYHPLEQFVGKLYVADGNNLQEIDSTGTVTSTAKLSPALPSSVVIRDMNVSLNGVYLNLAASYVPWEGMEVTFDYPSTFAGPGFIFSWNGTDAGITTYRTYPSHAITGIEAFQDSEHIFSDDAFGMAFSDSTGKKLTLPGNRAAFPQSITGNGNFATWMCTEAVDSTLKGSMYYYGQLDAENSLGLYRMFRLSSTQTNGFIFSVPWNTMCANKFTTLDASQVATAVIGYGKHYFSTIDIANGGGTTKRKWYRFLVTPSGAPALQGVYETQTQLFSKKISITQIRVYTEPTTTANGFQLDCINNTGAVITNGSFTYAYAAGTDPTKLQGALERINFNPAIDGLFGLGLRITNTTTTNMTIKKIEVDYTYSGK